MSGFSLLLTGVLALGEIFISADEGLPPGEALAKIEESLSYLNRLTPDQAEPSPADLDGVLNQLKSVFPEAEEGLGAWRRWEARYSEFAKAGKEVLLTDIRKRLLVWKRNIQYLQENPPPPGENRESSRFILQGILKRKEFDPRRYQENWLNILSQRIRGFLLRLLRSVISDEMAPRIIAMLGKLFWWGLAIFSLAVLFWFLKPYLSFPVKRESAAPPERSSTILLDDPAILKRKADACLQDGRMREALRYYYLTVLALLERRGLVSYNRSRTNWEYLRELSQKKVPASLLAVFSALNGLYDRKWYGEKECTRDDLLEFENGLALMERVE